MDFGERKAKIGLDKTTKEVSLYFCFFRDRTFRIDKLTKIMQCSKRTIHRYFQNFQDAGIIKEYHIVVSKNKLNQELSVTPFGHEPYAFDGIGTFEVPKTAENDEHLVKLRRLCYISEFYEDYDCFDDDDLENEPSQIYYRVNRQIKNANLPILPVSYRTFQRDCKIIADAYNFYHDNFADDYR